MKTTTKLSLVMLGLTAVFLLNSSFTRSGAESDYATMRTIEASMGGSKIIISYEGKTEELELERGTTNNMASNTQKINNAINMLAGKGYVLVAQSGGDYISMYSFVKK